MFPAAPAIMKVPAVVPVMPKPVTVVAMVRPSTAPVVQSEMELHGWPDVDRRSIDRRGCDVDRSCGIHDMRLLVGNDSATGQCRND